MNTTIEAFGPVTDRLPEILPIDLLDVFATYGLALTSKPSPETPDLAAQVADGLRDCGHEVTDAEVQEAFAQAGVGITADADGLAVAAYHSILLDAS